MKTPMKFEDLKLPQVDVSLDRYENRYRVARAVYDQMREHYEAKLAEAKPEPEELFEHPDMPGKKFRRLEVGETIRYDDWCSHIENQDFGGWANTSAIAGSKVSINDYLNYYREVPQPAPAWRLPDPPPGQQWHRTDWTQDMLVDAQDRQYRPLLDGEEIDPSQDQMWLDYDSVWATPADGKACKAFFRMRTRRPLPAPVEYVPLGPEDVPPGTTLRGAGEKQDAGWCMITSSSRTGIRIWRHSETNGHEMRWRDIMDSGAEILRPGSSTWEPCKKPKA